MLPTPQENHVAITYKDGFYEVVFQDMKPLTLDLYFSQLESIFKQVDVETVVRLLLHTTPDLPSFQNLAARDRALRAKFSRTPFVRLAILYTTHSHQSFVNLMLRVINLNNHMEMQIFSSKERDAAVRWLLR